MPYFYSTKHKINILFIHIPKTGGSSLETYFSKTYKISLSSSSIYGGLSPATMKKYNITNTLQHLTYQKIIECKSLFRGFSMTMLESNFKIITIVRNPYDRLVSDLFYHKYINNNIVVTIDIIKKYVADNCDNHSLPQHKFINENDINKNDIVILRTESLNDDMIKLGFADFNDLKINTNGCQNRKTYIDYLNRECIDYINDYYDNDFILFGYEKI